MKNPHYFHADKSTSEALRAGLWRPRVLATVLGLILLLAGFAAPVRAQNCDAACVAGFEARIAALEKLLTALATNADGPRPRSLNSCGSGERRQTWKLRSCFWNGRTENRAPVRPAGA